MTVDDMFCGVPFPSQPVQEPDPSEEPQKEEDD